MTDPRPKPQYGEYAPPGWVSPVQQPVSHAPESILQRQPDRRAPSAGPLSPRRPLARAWDRAVTFGLLVLWTILTIEGLFSFPQLSETLNVIYAQLGIGTFTLVDEARTAGFVLAGIQVLLLALTIWRSYRALRRDRLAFYWPLVGFVIFYVTLMVVMAVVVFSDPAYLAYVKTLGG
ncbi:DUF6264 family protein [Homoserinimonas sp. OAct 916]|uniref:DUF6264 family protein n=1 Tax=Homoserinimonas sp. OAct 916 TaxID=2211450 RepID=UPI001300A4F6|nr:DUF6264 family protein [Homoserinimonas sp. OAct 916]